MRHILTHHAMLQAQMAQLQEGIKAVDHSLHGEVHARQASLLQQADSLQDAQAFMLVTTHASHCLPF